MEARLKKIIRAKIRTNTAYILLKKSLDMFGHLKHESKIPQTVTLVTHDFVAQIGCWDSLYESNVIAEGHEQLGPYEV
jgi:hypothetical protein